MPDLFGEEIVKVVAITKDGRIRGGYACRPGTGPKGETCKTCEHYCRSNYHNVVYRKCALVKWTHGPGTDIKASAPACAKWQPKDGEGS
jgi:hypothetical protein